MKVDGKSKSLALFKTTQYSNGAMGSKEEKLPFKIDVINGNYVFGGRGNFDIIKEDIRGIGNDNT